MTNVIRSATVMIAKMMSSEAAAAPGSAPLEPAHPAATPAVPIPPAGRERPARSVHRTESPVNHLQADRSVPRALAALHAAIVPPPGTPAGWRAHHQIENWPEKLAIFDFSLSEINLEPVAAKRRRR